MRNESSFVDSLSDGNMPSIILIGNGVTATIEPIGHVIDLFGEVVRFNGGVLNMEGKEASLGSKTTTWVLNEDMEGHLRPRDVMSMVRILPDGYEDHFHADAIIKRQLDGIPFPSSGVVMAANFIRYGLKIYTVGMDGYAGGGGTWWDGDSSREHNSALEMKFWTDNYDSIIPLRDII